MRKLRSLKESLRAVDSMPWRADLLDRNPAAVRMNDQLWLPITEACAWGTRNPVFSQIREDRL